MVYHSICSILCLMNSSGVCYVISSTHLILFRTSFFLHGVFMHSILSLLLIQIKSWFEGLCNHFNEVAVPAHCFLFILNIGLGK